MTHGTRSIFALACAAVFALAMVLCFVPCADVDADHHADDDGADHCSLHCACQGLGLPAIGVEAPAAFARQSWSLMEAAFKLPLFATSIFQPPRA